jgi:hypothetical protein
MQYIANHIIAKFFNHHFFSLLSSMKSRHDYADQASYSVQQARDGFPQL